MNTLKCSACGKVIGELMLGSSITSGTRITCKTCYDKHVAKHNKPKVEKKPSKK